MYCRATSHILLVAMLLHAGMGCGWHYSRTLEGRTCVRHQVGGGDVAAEGHNHSRFLDDCGRKHFSPCPSSLRVSVGDRPKLTHHERPEPCPQHGCREGKCTYVATAKAAPPDGDTGYWQEVTIRGSSGVGRRPSCGNFCDLLRGASLALLSYRPCCAVTQVWLI